jgi:hypothetical protein
MRFTLLSVAALVAAQPLPAFAAPAPSTNDAAAVRAVPHSYVDAVEKLDLKATERLFSRAQFVAAAAANSATVVRTN